MSSSLLATVKSVTDNDAGGFVAVASTGRVDRDGEVIAPGAFNPLPESVAMHADHIASTRTIVARGRPYYEGERLMVEGKFGSDADSQMIRRKVADGIIDSLSIMFHGDQWETIKGTRTCVKGSLYAIDWVTIPSNVDARVLSVRSYDTGRALSKEALLAAARAELMLAGLSTPADVGTIRREADAALRRILQSESNTPTDEPTFNGRAIKSIYLGGSNL